MSDRPGVDDLAIRAEGDRVVVEIPGGRWEGDAAQAERLLTHLTYVVARARPGTNIASLFVNGRLYGGKVIEEDPERALDDIRRVLAQLERLTDRLAVEGPAVADEPPE